jgi:hypothetical protein
VTTERAAAALLLVCALGCADMNEHRRGDTVDVSSYPPDIQRAYKVFALRCSRCHTLARPLNARIHDPQHWIRYVTRMRRQPGSGIDHSNADLILKFLLFYHRAPADESEAEPAGATEPGAEPGAAEAAEPALQPEQAAPEPPQPEPPPSPPVPPEGEHTSPSAGGPDETSAPPGAPQGGEP